jgi:hypothetical protein
MPFDINEFKSRVGGALASPANFRVLFTGAIVDSDGSRLLSLLCNQAQLPGRSFATNEYTTHGPIRKVPYQSIYDDMVLSFYCQESMEINRIFQGWQTFIQDNSSSNEFSYFDDYVSDIIVEQLDNTGKVQYAVKLIDAYPVMVAPLQLEWSSQNSFHNVQVTMAYRYWREEPLDINPFGNFLNVNSLYPNFDIGGALEKTGVAIFSRADGQFMSTVQQGMSFNRNIRNSGNKSKSSLSSSQQDGTSDRHMLNN